MSNEKLVKQLTSIFAELDQKNARIWSVKDVDELLTSHGFKTDYTKIRNIADGKRWEQKETFMVALTTRPVERSKTSSRWFIGELSNGNKGKCFRTSVWNLGELSVDLLSNAIVMLIEIDWKLNFAKVDYLEQKFDIEKKNGKFYEKLNNPLAKPVGLKKINEPSISSPIKISQPNKRGQHHIRHGDTPMPRRKQTITAKINNPLTEQNEQNDSQLPSASLADNSTEQATDKRKHDFLPHYDQFTPNNMFYKMKSNRNWRKAKLFVRVQLQNLATANPPKAGRQLTNVSMIFYPIMINLPQIICFIR